MRNSCSLQTSIIIGACAAILALCAATAAGRTAIISGEDIHHPVFAPNGMVASQDAIATRVGVDILERGGNAVDAAVAIGFTLAVTLPRAGNLGGGGFMLVHSAKRDATVAIDYRETAPALAGRDMYLNEAGEVDSRESRFTHRSVGVPGTVAGLLLALDDYGTMSREEVMRPAIDLARNGFPAGDAFAKALGSRKDRLARNRATARIFLPNEGEPPEPGDAFYQEDLAWSLDQIAEGGAPAFYEGAIAGRIAADMRDHRGLITRDDLAAYHPVVRRPVVGTYRGVEIRSMPPPSSGGVHLVQILNVLEGFPIGFLGPNSADSIHVMAEAMKLAYADRAAHLGDPDFWAVPVAGLVSKRYAAALRNRIDLDRATPSTEIRAADPSPYESNETTHFSVMDRHGNVVSNTYTINFSFGAGVVAAGTGILLNNEMDDFSAKPGVPNAYGLVGGEANAIEPGKRPLSSMTPTIVFKDGKPLLATGSPGGSRIITTTLQILMNVVDHGMNIAAATATPRIHHQWLPDQLRVEKGLSPDTLDRLAGLGHEIAVKWAMGSTQSIMKHEDGFVGASDPRRPGALTAGY